MFIETKCFGASSRCILVTLLAFLCSGCQPLPRPSAPPAHHTISAQGRDFEVFVAPPPAGSETPCAWYGAKDGGVLYFGEAAFWSALRKDGKPTADLQQSAPQRIGRFSLELPRRMLPPLQLAADRPSGVWDVFPHPNGRLYFTTFFESAGAVDLATGDVERFPGLGKGLNEWAQGPGDSLLVSRYGSESATDKSGNGSVLWMDSQGHALGEIPLRSTSASTTLAPKTVAWDPGQNEIWVTTDVIPQGTGPKAHPALVLDFDGNERLRLQDVEIQFVRFTPAGEGYFAIADGDSLYLGILPAGAAVTDMQRILLEARFASDYDFAQDLEVALDGRVVVTTWSGGIYVVAPNEPQPVRPVKFPRLHEDGLYYTAVLAENHLCATYCADLAVVCTDLD